MRFRDIFLISMVGLVSYAFWSVGGTDISPGLSRAKKINREDARRQGTYLLNKNDWIEFQVSKKDISLRLLTNAAVANPNSPSTSQKDPRQGWRYSIEYELINEQEQVIEAQKYHFRSKVQPLLDNETGQEIYPLFFGKSSFIATQTRAMQLPVESRNQRIASIRIRLNHCDEEINEVVARLHSRVERTDYDEKQTWSRISQERRERICRYCVYDHELLTEDEKAQLLRWKWRVAPTLGEFEKRTLYSIGNFDDLPVDATLLPSGLYAAPEMLATIPLPEEPGNVKLKIQCDDAKPESSIRIEYFGRNIFVRDCSEEPLRATNEINLAVNGGLIQLKPTQPCIIRAFWSEQDPNPEAKAFEEFDITPTAMKVPSYLIDKRTVQFPVSHLQNQDTPFRLTIREIRDASFFSERKTNERGAIQWEMLDADGQVVKQGELEVESQISAYDYFSLDRNYYLLSDPHTVHFSIPIEVKSIQLRSESYPVFVNAAVRPSGLKAVTRIPEDYIDFFRLEKGTRTWFPLKPVNQKRLVEENRTFTANLQARPPETDPAILAGDYVWNRFLPDGNWIGREILTPHAEESPLRDEALPSVYYPVDHHLAKFENLNSKQLDKTILFDSRERPGRIRVHLGQQLIYDKKIIAKQGQIKLAAALFDQDGMLSIESENPTQFFVGGLKFNSVQPYLKRTAQRLDNGHLVFRYNKRTQDKELLILKFFQSESEHSRVRYRVKINPLFDTQSAPISNDWTNRNREFDIKTNAIAPSIVLGDQKRADTGYQCFIPLNRDLPSGEYEIHIEQLGASATNYVLCYQTVVEKRQLATEANIQRSYAPRAGIQAIVSSPSTEAQAPSFANVLNSKDDFLMKPPQNLAVSEPEAKAQQSLKVNLDEFTAPDSQASMLSLPATPEESTSQHSILQLLDANETRQPTVHYRFIKTFLDRSKGETTATPHSPELREVQRLFEQTVKNPLSPQWVDDWHRLGWELNQSTDNELIVISERQDRKTGRGLYVIRPNSDSKLVIQAPHRFFDVQTGTIAVRLFTEHDIKAIALNTVHRQHVDVAHQDRHEFNSFMNAMANQDPLTSFVQIHGFESRNKTGEAKHADIIVSDTYRYPGLVVKEITQKLKAAFGNDLVKLFPNEVRQLGGTQNSQSNILKSQSPFRRFFHLELDADFRNSMHGSASKRDEFIRCIQEVLQNSGN